MPFLALLTDRAPQTALPALPEVHADLKLEPLSVASLDHVLRLEPEAVVVDAGEHPAQAWSVLQALRARDARMPAVLIVERDQLERYPWHEVADEFVYPGAPAGEIRARLAMLRRRTGAGDGTVIRHGPALPRHGDVPRHRERPPAGPHVQGVRAAAVPGVASGTRVHAAGPAPRGLGLRLLRRHAHGRRPRAPAPRQARTRARAPDRDGARRRVPSGRSRAAVLGRAAASVPSGTTGDDPPVLCAGDPRPADDPGMNGAIRTGKLAPSVGPISLSTPVRGPFRRPVPARATAHPARASGSGR